MEVTNCCEAPFYEPGYPDSDICSACKEHAVPMEYDNDEAMHTGASIVKSNDNVEGVFMKNGEVVSVDYHRNKMTLKQIAERFEKFLSNDIEGLGNDERNELLECCSQLRGYSTGFREILDVLQCTTFDSEKALTKPVLKEK